MKTADEVSHATIESGRLERRVRRRISSNAPLISGVAAIVVLILAWQLASSHRLVASPLGAITELREQFATEGFAQEVLWSLNGVFAGLVIASGLGLVIGIPLGISRRLHDVVGYFVYVYATIPKIVLYPIILVIFGIGLSSEVAFAVASAVAPIAIGAMVGAGETPKILLNVARTFNASVARTWLRVILPSAAPSLVAGMRLGFSLCITHVILAEMFIGGRGLGGLIWRAFRDLRIDMMFAVLLLSVVIAVTGNLLLLVVERMFRGRSSGIVRHVT